MHLSEDAILLQNGGQYVRLRSMARGNKSTGTHMTFNCDWQTASLLTTKKQRHLDDNPPLLGYGPIY